MPLDNAPTNAPVNAATFMNANSGDIVPYLLRFNKKKFQI